MNVCVCVCVWQYNNNQYADMVRLQLQYKSVKDEMSRLQMQLANVDSQIVPGQHSTAHDRYVFFGISQHIGCGERFRNDLFCVELG